jgi:hypothetical protein
LGTPTLLPKDDSVAPLSAGASGVTRSGWLHAVPCRPHEHAALYGATSGVSGAQAPVSIIRTCVGSEPPAPGVAPSVAQTSCATTCGAVALGVVTR